MSTLTTRIAGYKVVIEPATQEQIDSHNETRIQMHWPPANYSRAVTARFVSESGDVMDLPFELRSTIMTVNPEMVLPAMAQHVETLQERVSYQTFCECFRSTKTCEPCAIETAMLARTKMRLRGNSWKFRHQNVKFS